MKVRATGQYEKLGKKDKILKRIPKEGEEFEVSEERFKVLNGFNSFGVSFVELVENAQKNGEKIARVAKENSKKEKATETKKKTQRKKKEE